jgi:PPP family 3-phenylpropionic acid transporter
MPCGDWSILLTQRAAAIGLSCRIVIRLCFQYLLAFGLFGTFQPYLPVLLRERGLSQSQVGYVIGLAHVGLLVTPVLLTLLADLHWAARRLLAMCFIAGAGMLLLLIGAEGFWPLLLSYLAFALALAPMVPLQDGLNFAVMAERERSGAGVIPFHRIRVWGTVGYILPGLMLFWPLRGDWPTVTAMWLAVGIAGLGLVNTFALPHPKKDVEGLAERRKPTLSALRVMGRRRLLLFCLALAVSNISVAAYYGFYPQHLTERVGLDDSWLSITTLIAVGLEIFLMLGFGRVRRWIGLRGIVVLGAAALALRLLLLGLTDDPIVAIATQVLHAPMVMLIHVAPPVFLNEHAEDHFRSSLQGLFAMVTMGVARMAGTFMAGHLADVSLSLMFYVGSGLGAVAIVLLLLAFRGETDAAGSKK